MGYGEADRFDHGGVAFTGPLLECADLLAVPRLKRWKGRYWCLYGCYPEQGGYELGCGGQGLA
jgi:hypothetical protein